ncbi:MAG: hypothetical protein GY944_09955 [bacterium]|nr:hypothetical protein [bacterium]
MTIDLQSRAVRVRFDDSPALAWFWAMGRAAIEYNGQTIDMDGAWSERVGSALRYLDTFNPPFIENHDRDNRPMGVVRRGRVLNREEAAELGIEQEHPEALYLGVDLNATGQAAEDAGELVYTSLGFDLAYDDERGDHWPMAIKEFSSVSVPHSNAAQIPRPSLRSIQLSETDEVIMTENENATAEGTAVEVQEGGGVAEMLGSIQSMLAELLKRSEPDPSMADCSYEDKPADDDEKPAEMGDEEKVEMAELRKRVGSLQARLAEQSATAAVDKLRSTKCVSDEQAEAARAMFLRDPQSFAVFADALTDRPVAEERAGGASQTQRITLGERAYQIQAAEGGTFSDALTKARSEGYTRTVEG